MRIKRRDDHSSSSSWSRFLVGLLFGRLIIIIMVIDDVVTNSGRRDSTRLRLLVLPLLALVFFLLALPLSLGQLFPSSQTLSIARNTLTLSSPVLVLVLAICVCLELLAKLDEFGKFYSRSGLGRAYGFWPLRRPRGYPAARGQRDGQRASKGLKREGRVWRGLEANVETGKLLAISS